MLLICPCLAMGMSLILHTSSPPAAKTCINCQHNVSSCMYTIYTILVIEFIIQLCHILIQDACILHLVWFMWSYNPSLTRGCYLGAIRVCQLTALPCGGGAVVSTPALLFLHNLLHYLSPINGAFDHLHHGQPVVLLFWSNRKCLS